MSEYNIKETLEEVTGYIGGKVKEGLETKESTFRFTTMPTASASNLGQVVQYLGNSTQTYTQGTSYKCVAKGTTPETYEWVAFGGVKDDRIGNEINNIKVRFDDGIRPYITANLDVLFKPFNEISLDEIKYIADAYYEGQFTLEDIQERWNIGDTKTFDISAMSAQYVGETHDAQTVTMRIVDFDHDILTNAKGEKTKALLTFGFMLSENGKMSDNNAHGYSESQRRTWCNDTCYKALPEALQEALVSVQKENGVGTEGRGSGTKITSDKLFIPNLSEFYVGGFAPGRMWRTYHIDVDGDTSTRYEWYKNDSHLQVGKEFWTATSAQYWHTDGYWVDNLWMYITTGGGKNDAGCTENKGIFVHGCI